MALGGGQAGLDQQIAHQAPVMTGLFLQDGCAWRHQTRDFCRNVFAWAVSVGLLVGCSTSEPELAEGGMPGVSEQATSCEGNLALGRPTTASGYWSTGTPERGVDGDMNTTWRTNASTGAWLQVDLGAAYSLNRAAVKWAWDSNFGTSADSVLEGSLDGTSRRSTPALVPNLMNITTVAAGSDDRPHRVLQFPRAEGGWHALGLGQQ